MFLYFQTKLGLFFILLLSLLKNLLVSRSSKENVREEKRTTSDTHMGHNRNCHSLEALRITQKTSTREEKFLAGKKLASTSCVEADRLNRVLFFSVADSRSAPYGCSELPRCVLHDTAFWNHFKFWQTRLFLVQLSRSWNLGIKDIAYFRQKSRRKGAAQEDSFMRYSALFYYVRDLYALSFFFFVVIQDNLTDLLSK